MAQRRRARQPHWDCGQQSLLDDPAESEIPGTPTQLIDRSAPDHGTALTGSLLLVLLLLLLRLLLRLLLLLLPMLQSGEWRMMTKMTMVQTPRQSGSPGVPQLPTFAYWLAAKASSGCTGCPDITLS